MVKISSKMRTMAVEAPNMRIVVRHDALLSRNVMDLHSLNVVLANYDCDNNGAPIMGYGGRISLREGVNTAPFTGSEVEEPYSILTSNATAVDESTLAAPTTSSKRATSVDKGSKKFFSESLGVRLARTDAVFNIESAVRRAAGVATSAASSASGAAASVAGGVAAAAAAALHGAARKSNTSFSSKSLCNDGSGGIGVPSRHQGDVKTNIGADGKESVSVPSNHKVMTISLEKVVWPLHDDDSALGGTRTSSTAHGHKWGRDSQLRTAFVSGVSFSKVCKIIAASPYVDNDEQVIKIDQVHFRGVEPSSCIGCSSYRI